MSTLVETFAIEDGCVMVDTETGELMSCRRCTHRADLVAEWLESDETEEAAYAELGDLGAAKVVLAALAAHAKRHRE